MRLEDLVPPLDLCKRIPNGCFEESALVWWGDQYFQHYMLDFRLAGPSAERDAIAYPAPTLQEIMGELPERTQCRTHNYRGKLRFVLDDVPGLKKPESEENASEAALKLWLEMEGEKKMNEAYSRKEWLLEVDVK